MLFLVISVLLSRSDKGIGMARAYSADLRRRVVDAAMGGLSARQAAERFDVGTATAIVWVRRFREGGELVARRQG
ncbi:helix-turn-helix domain-containing protein, partial [Azotobacter vinelandii]